MLAFFLFSFFLFSIISLRKYTWEILKYVFRDEGKLPAILQSKIIHSLSSFLLTRSNISSLKQFLLKNTVSQLIIE